MLEIKVVTASKVVVRQLDFLKLTSKEVFESMTILGRVRASIVEDDPYWNHDYLIATGTDGITGLVNLPRNSWGIAEVAKHPLVVLV